MNKQHSDQSPLEVLISGLEDDLLRMGDSAILSDKDDTHAPVDEIRALIHSQIECQLNLVPSHSSLDRRPERSRLFDYDNVEPLSIPESPKDRRRLLEALMAKRPSLSRRCPTSILGRRKTRCIQG